MLFKREKEAGKAIRFRLLFALLPVIAAVLILTTLFYHQFEKISLNMLETTNYNLLSQSSTIYSYISDIISISGKQLFYDDAVTNLRTRSRLSNAEIALGCRMLDSIGGYESSVHSVYIYNSKTNSFYTSSNVPGVSASDFYDQGVRDLLGAGYGPFSRFIPKPFGRGLDEVNTYLLSETDSDGKLLNAMVINIYADWLDSVLGSLFGDTEVLVLNEQGRLIGKTFAIDKETEEKIETLIRTRTGDSGRFVVRTDQGKDIYLYSVMQASSWCFVRHIRWNELFRDLDLMKAYTYSGIVVAITLVFLIGLWNTMRFFRPLKRIEQNLIINHLPTETPYSVDTFVDKLIESSTSAKILEENYLCHVRSEYLRQLMSRSSSNMETITSEFTIYKVPFDLSKTFHIIIFTSDSELLRSAFSGLPELVSISVSEKNHSQLFFFQGDVKWNDLEALCNQFACKAAISNPCSWVGDVKECAERVSEVLSYSVFTRCKRMVYEEGLLDEKLSLLPARYNREPQILALISAARLEDAYALYCTYSEEISICRFSSIVFLLRRLYMGVVGQSMEVADSVMAEIDSALMDRLDKKAVDELFYSVFAARVEKILRSKESRIGVLVKKVDQIIEDEHTNTSLSIQVIAESLDMSPVYLGKLYRQETGHSIAESINDCRLRFSKQLLIETDLTVKEVAMKAGFPNVQYFFTLFRNATSLSPSEFRARR